MAKRNSLSEIEKRIEKYVPRVGEEKIAVILYSKDAMHNQELIEVLSRLPRERYNVSYETLPCLFIEGGVDALLRIIGASERLQLITLSNIKTFLGLEYGRKSYC